MKYYLFLIIFLLLFSLTNTYAQEVKGTVFGVDETGNKTSLSKATLFWLGTSKGTIADLKGKFNIKKNSLTNKLVARYVGYIPDTLEVTGNSNNLEILLKPEFSTNEIVVTGRQMSTMISESDPFKTEILTKRSLQKAACCNLSESFQTNPSVDVSFTDAVTGAKQIKLLGLEGAYTQMLTEKIPNLRGIATPYGLTYIPGTWMESIQISKGASSVTTGYESITGQINIEYKKPETKEPTLINAYANQFGRFEGNFNSSMELSDSWSTMLLGNGNMLRNEIDHNQDGFLDKPKIQQLNLMNRWKYIGETHESVSGAKLLLEDRLGGQHGWDNSNRNNIYGTSIVTQRVEAFTKNGFLIPAERFTSLGTILSGTYHNQKSVFGKTDYDARQSTFYANVLFQSSLDGTQENEDECEGGHEGHEEESQDEASEFNESVHNYTIGLSYILDDYREMINSDDLSRTESVPGIFGEYTLNASDDLTIVGGFRADFHNLYGTFYTPRFHVKYNAGKETFLRASAGKGFRVSNPIAENPGLLASSREFKFDEKLRPEEAWNYGANITTEFDIFDYAFLLNAEFYRTEFINQVIIDTEQNPGEVHFYNLDGKSYSNSFQIDLSFEPIWGLEVMTAYRINDVKMTYNGVLKDKPLISSYKAFANLAYTTDDDEWLFDITFDYNGSGRLPNTATNPENYRLGETFPAFLLVHSQITKRFDGFELYLGAENLTNYRQPFPILAWDDPFGKYFDSSMIWGPIAGTIAYLGFRWTI